MNRWAIIIRRLRRLFLKDLFGTSADKVPRLCDRVTRDESSTTVDRPLPLAIKKSRNLLRDPRRMLVVEGVSGVS
jgi:hypothetical protein